MSMMSMPLDTRLLASEHPMMPPADWPGLAAITDSLPDELALGMECATPFLWPQLSPDARG